MYLQTSGGGRLTGTPEEIPTSQANRGPGSNPKQEVPALALPFPEHQQRQEALAGCAWRLCQSAVKVRCSLLLGLARQVTHGLVCPGSSRELLPIDYNPGPFNHPEDTGPGASLADSLGVWVCRIAEGESYNLIYARQVSAPAFWYNFICNQVSPLVCRPGAQSSYW